MLQIENITITSEAASALRMQKSRLALKPRDLFALYYMSSYATADGVSVRGFQPGYTPNRATPPLNWTIWANAKLGDGLDFIFMPKFKWSATENYVVSLIDGPVTLFSISPAM